MPTAARTPAHRQRPRQGQCQGPLGLAGGAIPVLSQMVMWTIETMNPTANHLPTGT